MTDFLSTAGAVAGGGGALAVLGWTVWKLADALAGKKRISRSEQDGNGSGRKYGCDPSCIRDVSETRDSVKLMVPALEKNTAVLERLEGFLIRMDERDKMRSTGEHRIAGGG